MAKRAALGKSIDDCGEQSATIRRTSHKWFENLTYNQSCSFLTFSSSQFHRDVCDQQFLMHNWYLLEISHNGKEQKYHTVAVAALQYLGDLEVNVLQRVFFV